MALKDIRQALLSLLLGDAGIVGIVGSRVFPMVLPQGVEDPSIVYSRVSEQEGYHSQGPDGLVSVRMQIDCYALTQDGASDLALVVKEAISGYRGTVIYGAPPVACVIQGIFFDSGREDFNDDTKHYRMSRDYLIWFDER